MAEVDLYSQDVENAIEWYVNQDPRFASVPEEVIHAAFARCMDDGEESVAHCLVAAWAQLNDKDAADYGV